METKTIFSNIDETRIQSFVRHFSSYQNRYYKTKAGLESQRWLLTQVYQSFKGYVGNFTVLEFKHEWSQKTIIAKIAGNDDSLKKEVIIVGAHLVSILMTMKYLSKFIYRFRL